jgi:hypothetical protein
MLNEKPGTLPHQAIPQQNMPVPSEGDQSMEVLIRFRRDCIGIGYQALRSAVLTYLSGSKR